MCFRARARGEVCARVRRLAPGCAQYLKGRWPLRWPLFTSICGKNWTENITSIYQLVEMFSRRIRRFPLVVFLITVIILILCAFLNVPFGGSNISKPTTPSGDHITMLTFNVWYSNEKIQERMEALGQIVQHLKPDFLILQEIALNNLPLLEKQRWSSKYRLIPPKVDTMNRIETAKSCAVILSRFDVDNWQIHPFKDAGKYSRALVKAEVKDFLFQLKDFKLVIAGTHLSHDVSRTTIREEQLKEALEVLSPYENVCLLGDLNILDEVDGEVVLPSSWVDAWMSIPGHTHGGGYTISQNTSPFTSVRKRNGTSSGRLDRIFCKLLDFDVKEVRIVGDQMTESGILPSDHFGVFAIIKPSLYVKTNKQGRSFQTENQVYFKRPQGWEGLAKT